MNVDNEIYDTKVKVKECAIPELKEQWDKDLHRLEMVNVYLDEREQLIELLTKQFSSIGDFEQAKKELLLSIKGE